MKAKESLKAKAKRKGTRAIEVVEAEVVLDAKKDGRIIDHHVELELHFEEYEMSKAPGS